jgi:uncharacterized protein
VSAAGGDYPRGGVGEHLVLPVFPLGNVVLPGAAVPLHVFEPRYRALMADLTEGRVVPPRFGIVLVLRGSEVGGGEERAELGTVVGLIRHAQLPDGRWLLVASGAERFRVRRWLPDDPYPLAEAEILATDEWDPADDGALEEAAREVRRARAMAVELGLLTGGDDAIPVDNPVAALWQLAALAPLGSYDRQSVLEAGPPGERARLLARLAAEAAETLAFRLGGA